MVLRHSFENRPILSFHSCLWRALHVLLLEVILSRVKPLDRAISKCFRRYPASRFAEFDTFVICHVFMYLGSSLLQDMFLKLSKHLFSRDKTWNLPWTCWARLYYVSFPKGAQTVKNALHYFFCLQSEIAVWALKRMPAFLLSLLMRMIREHVKTHMVKKWWIYIKCRPWKEARIYILWFLLRSSHIPLALRPHWTFLSVLWNGRTADFTRNQFTSEHFWVNLSRTSRTMLYQMSHPLLIM